MIYNINKNVKHFFACNLFLGGINMKKTVFLWIMIFSFSYGELSEYKSKFGLGVGLGFPTGYEFKGVYRQNEWLSLSLNYNTFEIDGLSYEMDGPIEVTGTFKFSTPGVVLNYHPFGGNMRLSAGFLYDMGGLELGADGTIDLGGVPATVTGDISIKFGRTYPYLGLAYGYDFNSVVHLELSLGVYMLKRPEVSLYFNVDSEQAIKDALTSANIPANMQADILAALAASGGNILDLPQIIADEFGLPNTVAMPDANELEGDMVALIQEGYNYLPAFLGYNLFPTVSIGFTFFPF